jgi:hypothetical protein
MKIKIDKRSGAVLRTKNKYCNEDISIVLDSKLFPAGKINISDTKEVDVTKYEKAQIIDENLKAENIAEGVEVLGITGTHAGGGIEPAGTKEIDQNGLYDIKEYEFVDVSVKEKPQQQKSVEYIENGEYEVLPDEDNVLSQVMVSVKVPTPSGKINITTTNEVDVTAYETAQINDSNLKAENIAEGIEILGIVGEFRGGIDTSDATATGDDILLGKTAYVGEEKIEGTIETYDYSTSNEVKPEIDRLLQGEIVEYYNDRVTSLRSGMFSNLNITSVDFPNLKTINTSCFANAKNLTNVNIPNATSIFNSAFQGCSGLKTMYLPKVVRLYPGVFSNSNYLELVYTRDLKNLDAQTFSNCSRLKTLIIDSNTVPVLQNSNAFYNVTSVVIYVKDGMIDSFKSASNWSGLSFEYKPISDLPQEIKEELES